MADPKILERINKLVQLAGPQNENQHERESAAAEVIKLIHEHGLAVGEAATPSRQERHWGRTQTGKSSPGPGWSEVDLAQNVRCAGCWQAIRASEIAWHHPRHGYLHHDASCHDASKWRPPPPPPPSSSQRPWSSFRNPPAIWQPRSRSGWNDVQLGRETRCSACGRIIEPGETAWSSPIHGIRCENITCYEDF